MTYQSQPSVKRSIHQFLRTRLQQRNAGTLNPADMATSAAPLQTQGVVAGFLNAMFPSSGGIACTPPVYGVFLNGSGEFYEAYNCCLHGWRVDLFLAWDPDATQWTLYVFSWDGRIGLFNGGADASSPLGTYSSDQLSDFGTGNVTVAVE